MEAKWVQNVNYKPTNSFKYFAFSSAVSTEIYSFFSSFLSMNKLSSSTIYGWSKSFSSFFSSFFSYFYYSFGCWYFWHCSLNLVAIHLNFYPWGPFIMLAKKFNPWFNPGSSKFFPLISIESWLSSITAISFNGFWWTFLILRRGWSWSIIFSQLLQRSKSEQITHLCLGPLIGSAPQPSQI